MGKLIHTEAYDVPKGIDISIACIRTSPFLSINTVVLPVNHRARVTPLQPQGHTIIKNQNLHDKNMTDSF